MANTYQRKTREFHVNDKSLRVIIIRRLLLYFREREREKESERESEREILVRISVSKQELKHISTKKSEKKMTAKLNKRWLPVYVT